MTEGLEIRAATQVGVNARQRLITLVAVPWEQEAMVYHQGRMVREVFTRGAFDGIERRANRVRINRDHDVARTVGRAVAFHTARPEGLVAEVRIAKTQLGDETLALADEEILDASVAFRPLPDGEEWVGHDLRRINKAWLGHVALTPDPAYEGARVMSVRAVDEPLPVRTATPNLDLVRGWLLEDKVARLGGEL